MHHEFAAVDTVKRPQECEVGAREEEVTVYDVHFFLNFTGHLLPILLFIAQPLDENLHVLRTFIVLSDFPGSLLELLLILQYEDFKLLDFSDYLLDILLFQVITLEILLELLF